jgi:tripartite ATP-independent transporter DctP family solute receptor
VEIAGPTQDLKQVEMPVSEAHAQRAQADWLCHIDNVTEFRVAKKRLIHYRRTWYNVCSDTRLMTDAGATRTPGEQPRTGREKMSILTRVRFAATLAFALTAAAQGTRAADIRERTIKLPVVANLDHPQGLGAKKFGELVEKNSGGKIKTRIFPGGSLGGEVQVVSALQGGSVEAAVVAPAVLVGQIKEFIILDFPFVFENETEASLILDGPIGKRLLDRLPEKGLIGLAYMEVGFRHFTNGKRPLKKLEDFTGLKLRAVQNPLYIDFTNALGANAVALPYTELYTALETQVIDGHENPYTTVESAKFDEVQKHLSVTNHIYNPQLVLISQKFWDQLSQDEQKILQDAANEAREYQRKVARELNDAARETLEKRGMLVNELPAEEIARLREKAKPVVEKYANQVGESLMTEFYAELEKVRQKR